MRSRRGWLRIRPQDLTPQGIARLSRAICRMDGLVALLSGIARHPDAECGQGVRLGDLVGSLAIRRRPPDGTERRSPVLDELLRAAEGG